MLFRSLRTRIALATVAAAALVIGVVGFLVVTGFARSESAALDQRLAKRAEQIAPPGLLDALTLPRRGLLEQSEPLLVGSGDLVRIVQDDRVVGGIADPLGQELPIRQREGFSTIEEAGEAYRLLAVPVPGPPGAGAAQLQIAAPLAPVEASVARLRQRVLTLGLIALAAAGAAGWAFGGIALRSLRRLRIAASRVSSTRDLSTRVPAREGPTEVDELAGSLNAMLERLESSSGETVAALEATRRFAADAGHELRTPLTAMGANLDALRRNPDMTPAERREVLDAVLEEQGRMVALLDSLQALARADAGTVMHREPVDLAELADAAVDAARRRHPGARIELGGEDADGPVTVEAWPQGVRLALDNLIENAVRHGGEAGPVEVSTGAANGAAVVRVDDSGPGVPHAERGEVFGRFARGSTARGEGSGLGLALVAQQAALHGGSVDLGDSPLGGARFSLRLPVRAGPEATPQ
jgi:two-component system, OmpR family, sensor histidine kinase PrrB